jgi:uncharacterized protein (TIGR02145 family)
MRFNLRALIATAMLLASCKVTQPTGPPSGGTASIADVHSILNSTETIFTQSVNASGGSPQQAIMKTENWLQSQPSVQTVFDVDSTYLYIKLRSGLLTMFYFEQLDANGYSLTRGGPSNKGTQSVAPFCPPSRHAITNKNVLIYAPQYSNFYYPGQMQTVLDLFTKSGAGMSVTLATDQQCPYQVIDNLNNYGLVILDTHGAADGFLTGSIVHLTSADSTEAGIRAKVDAQIGIGSSNLLTSGDLRFAQKKTIPWLAKNLPVDTSHQFDSLEVWITSKHIASLSGLSKTMIFGNMCYSGYFAPCPKATFTSVGTAFLATSPEGYFCYGFSDSTSTGVSDDFAKQMEVSVVTALVINYDSTGIAYTKPDNTQYFDTYIYPSQHGNLFFEHTGPSDYSYMPCIDSFTDARDGQRYHTRCFGDQIWMQENLNYNAPGSFWYENSAGNGAIYGRLYPWLTIMNGASSSDANPSGVTGVCPYGWHVPSKEEWQQLQTTLGRTNDAAALKLNSNDPNVGGWISDSTATNSSGFSALAGGYFTYNGANQIFTALGNAAMFHTATLNQTTGVPGSIWLYSNFPVAKYDLQPSSSITDPNQPSSNASCRCVKDQ